MASNDGYRGAADTHAQGSPYNAQASMVAALIGEIMTCAMVRVESVDPDALTVNVLPLVAQVDGNGVGAPHGTLYALPYFRYQGGTDAIVLDPKKGDIGLALFCARDTSVVKTTKAPALPGSARRYDWADGQYIGGWLNGTPTQLIRFASDGITVTSPTKVTVQAPEAHFTGKVTVVGDIEAGAKLTVTGDISGAAKLAMTGDITGAAKLTIVGDTSLGGGALPVLLQGGGNATKVKGT